MSISAHKLNYIGNRTLKYEESSFNIWHDEELIQFLNSECDFCMSLNDDCCGTTTVLVSIIKEAIQKAKELKLDEGTMDCLKNDIKGLEDTDYIEYYCF